MRVALLSILCVLSAAAAGPGPSLYLYGTVKHYSTGDSIPFPIIHLQEVRKDALPRAVVTNARGRYELNLTKEGIFTIFFDAPGKVGKLLEIDTHGARPDRPDGYGFSIDVTLFDSIPGVDFSVLNEPTGKVHFDPATNEFVWDFAYIEQIREKIARLFKEYDETRKGTRKPKY